MTANRPTRARTAATTATPDEPAPPRSAPIELAPTESGSRPRPARRSERERRALLALTTGDAQEVLERLVDGDPLDLSARLARRAAERALVLPPGELFARVAAHCARAARDYRGRPRVDLWVERRIDEVLAADGVDGAVERATDGADALASSARRFNACGRSDRAALWRLAFGGAGLDELAHERGTGLVEVARAARRALDALLLGSREFAVHDVEAQNTSAEEVTVR